MTHWAYITGNEEAAVRPDGQVLRVYRKGTRWEWKIDNVPSYPTQGECDTFEGAKAAAEKAAVVHAFKGT